MSLTLILLEQDNKKTREGEKNNEISKSFIRYITYLQHPKY